jgi:DNA-binding CsgD family transcriptional regulator
MGKVESIRLASAVSDRELPFTAAGRHGSELLDVLAAGEPAAFATDSRERVVFWNEGATALLGLRADEAIGRHCYEVLGGRDVFDNRFCYANCPLAAMSRAGEAPRAFELRVPRGDGKEPSTVHVTIVRLPGPRPDLFTIVHIVHGVDETERLARSLSHIAPTDMPAPKTTHPRGVESAEDAEQTGPGSLTPREREILGWMAGGLQNKEIAERLQLSLATVRNHIHNTLEKLGVHSKLEAVSLAYRNGWVSQGAACPPARG